MTSASALTALPIRELSTDDLPRLLGLTADRGWATEEDKWRLLLAVGTGYGIDAPDGAGLAAGYCLTWHGRDTAAVGMVLVAKRYARQGLGRRLMRHALASADGATVCLHATDQGRPLYAQLGFKATGTVTIRVGDYTPDPGVDTSGVRPAAARDDGAIRELDAEAFGADRTALVDRLPEFCDQVLVTEDGAGRLTGFGGAWSSGSQPVVGPVVAEDTATAKALITALAAGAGGGRLRIDADNRHEELGRWLDARGFAPIGPNSLMVYGAADVPGRAEKRFAPLTLAL